MQPHNLQSCPLFAGMTGDEIDAFLARSAAEVRTFEKGEYVARQGDAVLMLYLLTEGLVRTEMITKEGNVLEIEFIEPVRPLAPAFIFANRNLFPVDVIAMERSLFYIIERSVWLAEMMKHATLLTNFLKLNSNMTVFLANKVQMMSIKSLKGKLSLYILENTSADRASFTMKRTQTQLAEYFGVQRPSLSRTVGELIGEGVIAVEKRQITVLDRRKLERMI